MKNIFLFFLLSISLVLASNTKDEYDKCCKEGSYLDLRPHVLPNPDITISKHFVGASYWDYRGAPSDRKNTYNYYC